MQEKLPNEDEQRTHHIHDDGTWEWGVICLECMADVHQAGDMPMVNIKRLQADNAGHYTQRELGREITDAADRDGREIEHQN